MEDPFISQFQDTPADGSPYEDMSDLVQMRKVWCINLFMLSMGGGADLQQQDGWA